MLSITDIQTLDAVLPLIAAKVRNGEDPIEATKDVLSHGMLFLQSLASEPWGRDTPKGAFVKEMIFREIYSSLVEDAGKS
jgi:hypothetical protein